MSNRGPTPGPLKRHTTLSLAEDTRDNLETIRTKRGFKDWSAAITHLVELEMVRLNEEKARRAA